MFAWLRKFLATHPDAAPPSPDLFLPLDIEKVTRQLNIHELAASSGRNEMPASEARAFDANEQVITHYFEEDAQFTAKAANGKLLSYRNRLEQQDISAELDEIRNVAARFKAALGTTVEEFRDTLSDLRGADIALHDELGAFKKRNRLNRTARYPDSHFFLVTVLVLIVLAESALNGYFFAAGSEFGLGDVSVARGVRDRARLARTPPAEGQLGEYDEIAALAGGGPRNGEDLGERRRDVARHGVEIGASDGDETR